MSKIPASKLLKNTTFVNGIKNQLSTIIAKLEAYVETSKSGNSLGKNKANKSLDVVYEEETDSDNDGTESSTQDELSSRKYIKIMQEGKSPYILYISMI
jgi:hypothetical protein